MEALNLDELPVELKSTCFWLRYRNQHGEEVVTQRRSWLEHFQIDAEKGTGRTDMEYTLRIEEAPSTALRNWLEGDIFVELYSSQPKFHLKILEEGQTEPVKDTVLDDEGKPSIETKMLGVSTRLVKTDRFYCFFRSCDSILLSLCAKLSCLPKSPITTSTIDSTKAN